jgi:hypothetical protein
MGYCSPGYPAPPPGAHALAFITDPGHVCYWPLVVTRTRIYRTPNITADRMRPVGRRSVHGARRGKRENARQIACNTRIINKYIYTHTGGVHPKKKKKKFVTLFKPTRHEKIPAPDSVFRSRASQNHRCRSRAFYYTPLELSLLLLPLSLPGTYLGGARGYRFSVIAVHHLRSFVNRTILMF